VVSGLVARGAARGGGGGERGVVCAPALAPLRARLRRGGCLRYAVRARRDPLRLGVLHLQPVVSHHRRGAGHLEHRRGVARGVAFHRRDLRVAAAGDGDAAAQRGARRRLRIRCSRAAADAAQRSLLERQHSAARVGGGDLRDAAFAALPAAGATGCSHPRRDPVRDMAPQRR